MNKKHFLLLAMIGILALLLVGCESVAQAQQPNPTNIPSKPSLSADVNIQATPVKPASVPGVLNSTSANAAGISGSIGELRGIWTAEPDQLEIQVTTQTNLKWGGGLVRMHGIYSPGNGGYDSGVLEWFTYDNGILTWGDPSFSGWADPSLPGGFEDEWSSHPQAMYRVTITRNANQTDTLVLSLEGEDQVSVRQEFLDGRTFTRISWAYP